MGQSYSLRTTKTTYHPELKEWSAPPVSPIFSTNVSVGRLVALSLSAKPFNVAQICHEDGDQMLNWQVLRDSVRAALNLKDLGLAEGDVLGFVAYNTRNVAAVVFGCLKEGFPVSTVNPMFDANDVAHMFAITKPKVVVCDVDNYSEVKKAMAILDNPAPVYVFDAEGGSDQIQGEYLSVWDLIKPHAKELDYYPPDLTDGENLPAFIVCSSGTTGPPKAIICTHYAFSSIFSDRSVGALAKNFFGFSALYWGSGIAVLLISTVNNIPRVIVAKPFSPKLGIEIINKYEIEAIFCTPAQIQLMFQDESYREGVDLKSLKAVICGGSMVPKGLAQKTKLPILNGYGLSEGGGISVNGQLTGSCVVKIVDDEGNRLGVGEEGEVCAKFVYRFKGYYGQPDSVKLMLDEEDFMHTGDIGVFDEHGNLEVVDRKKDIFKYNNFHVSPSDIEKALEKIPGVNLICVVGIADPIFDCLPAAVIVKDERSPLSEKEIHQFTKDNMSPHKWLRGGVYFVEELPMTPTGKILRRVVKKEAEEMFRGRPDIGFKY